MNLPLIVEFFNIYALLLPYAINTEGAPELAVALVADW